MQDFKESLLLMVLQIGFVALLGLTLAITAIAQALPWIILAGAVGLCLVSITVTGCIIWVRRRQALERVKAFPEPISARGYQGLWDPLEGLDEPMIRLITDLYGGK